jgi:hypothetical protein
MCVPRNEYTAQFALMVQKERKITVYLCRKGGARCWKWGSHVRSGNMPFAATLSVGLNFALPQYKRF